MLPCTRCASSKTGRRCVSVTDDPKCSECTRKGKPCDVEERNRMPSLFEWESIDAQKRRLQQEEELAYKVQEEAMQKILRLRKQQRLLAEREQEMLRRGLANLQELDEAEERERNRNEEEKRNAEKEKEATRLAALPTSSGSDPAFDLGPRLSRGFPS